MKINNKYILLISTFFMYFSIGIWTNYRSLYLEYNNYSIDTISRIISISFILTSILLIITSLLSYKISIKNIVVFTIIIRFISLLLIKYNIIFIIISIICENIFILSFYPFISFIDDSDIFYKKKIIFEYFGIDIGIFICGYLLGKRLINYDNINILISFTSAIPFILLMFIKNNNINNNKIDKSILNILSDKSSRLYLLSSFFTRMSYSIIFDFIIIILINYLYLDLNISLLLIIISNMIGNIICIILNKKNINIKSSILIKYGSRVIIYLIAILINNRLLYLISICISSITSKILDNKTSGIFIRNVNNKDKFLFQNMIYFIESLSTSITTFLFGKLILISLKNIFIFSFVITIVQIIILIYDLKYIK